MSDNTKSEIDVINHLLQVEKDSALMIDEALQESEKRLAKARADFNVIFKEKYDKGVSELEEKFRLDSEKTVKSHEKILNDFKSELESKNQNVEAFNKVLDSILFEKL